MLENVIQAEGAESIAAFIAEPMLGVEGLLPLGWNVANSKQDM